MKNFYMKKKLGILIYIINGLLAQLNWGQDFRIKNGITGNILTEKLFIYL